MSNSCIHHLSKLSINKYLQSDVFLFHSLIAGDIKDICEQICLCRGDPLIGQLFSPIPVCLRSRARERRRLPLSAVYRHLLDVFSAPTHPFLLCLCLGVVFDSIIMSNSCIHHLSKLSINKYLQSDVFLFHSLIAGDIKDICEQICLCRGDPLIGQLFSPIPVCLRSRARERRRLPLSAVYRHLLDVFCTFDVIFTLHCYNNCGLCRCYIG